jgi:hypothetical protein
MSVTITSKCCRLWIAGLATVFAVALVVTGVRYAGGQPPAEPEAKIAPAKWTVLFRSDDPTLWDKNAKTTKGEQVAIPIKYAPGTLQYLRLRRMDIGDSLIIPMTYDDLDNGKPPEDEKGYWWNGSAKEEWKGCHLGIVQGPRHKFPAPRNMISVMNKGWDAFAGSGFGHKVGPNDKQYYCWRGKEIKRTEFEIAVTEGPLGTDEKRFLLGER